ncbi:MAG: carbonic anhydrase family protein [Flavobacteriales bacterium]|jgi:carbonic anhydrase|nr:carbonic anhydrase family protein [Flavobacteriales bacterium]
MKPIGILLSTTLIFALSSCQPSGENQSHTTTVEQKKHTKIESKTHQDHWTYQGETGPEHWSEIEKNSDCDGKKQSPINIIEVNSQESTSFGKKITTYYAPETKIHDVTNNGHSIQYNFEKGDKLSFEGSEYLLKQIHFHEPSEHTIDGIRYPMEIHLVHQNKQKEFVVLGILVKEGLASEPFNFLESYLPVKAGETKIVNQSFDLNKNLPENKTFFHYEGSLTTPPCTETVDWVVFQNPISISVEQVKILQMLMPHNNYRNEQPINSRVITKSSF